MQNTKGLTAETPCSESAETRPPLMLAVIRAHEGWTMLSRRGSWGRFAHRVDAEEAALRLAGRIRSQGGSVQVLVQSYGGELQPFAIEPVSVAA